MSLMLILAMPFLGVRIGIPMVSGGGNTTPPVVTAHPTYFIYGF